MNRANVPLRKNERSQVAVRKDGEARIYTEKKTGGRGVRGRELKNT